MGSDPVSVAPSPEVRRFTEEFLLPALAALFQGSYSDRDVQVRFDALRLRVRARYHPRELKVDFCPVLIGESLQIAMSYQHLSGGTPHISIVVPSYMKQCEFLKARDGDWRTRLENTFVISLFHELYHFAGGFTDIGDQLSNEVGAWADTCEGILGYFAETGRLLSEYDELVWNEWVRVGKTRNRGWIEVISRHYKQYI